MAAIAPSATTSPGPAAWPWRSQFAVFRTCQIPFKSGLPSAVRGALYAAVWPAAGRAASERRTPMIIMRMLVFNPELCYRRKERSVKPGVTACHRLSPPRENVLFVPHENVLLTRSSWQDGKRSPADDPERSRPAGGIEESTEEVDPAAPGS